MTAIAVVGTRSFNDYVVLSGLLDELVAKQGFKKITIVSGGARGADTLAERYATERNYRLKVYPAKWERYGFAAGPRRNQKIVKACDLVVAFWDGESRGTLSTLNMAVTYLRPLVVYNYHSKVTWKGGLA